MRYLNPLILGAFSLTFLVLYNRRIRANTLLETRVAERTAELEAVNCALLDSREHCRDLIEKANSIILRWTIDGAITFLNEFGQSFFGYVGADIIGGNALGTILPDTETAGRNLIAMMGDIKSHPEHYQTNKTQNKRGDGRLAWIPWTNRAVVDAGGCTTEILSISTDVTARRLAEERCSAAKAS